MPLSNDYSGAGLLFSLTTRIFSDAPPHRPLPAAYLFGQTPDNEESVLSSAAALLRAGSVERLLIAESEPWGGYAGHAQWRSRLEALGVVPEAVTLVPPTQPGSANTLTEALALAEVAGSEGWDEMLVLAAPFHLVRAFITTASVMIRCLPHLRVYAAAGEPQSWLAPAVHSQGILRAPRAGLLQAEFDRLVRYERKGDLLGPGEILAYLDRRGAASNGR